MSTISKNEILGRNRCTRSLCLPLQRGVVHDGLASNKARLRGEVVLSFPARAAHDGSPVLAERVRPLIAIEGASKTYTTALGARIKALDSVDLTVSDGEFISIVGPPDAARALFCA